MGAAVTQNAVWCLEKVGMVPKGTYSVGEDLKIAGKALVAGGQSKLFTPMALWVVRKVSRVARGSIACGRAEAEFRSRWVSSLAAR